MGPITTSSLGARPQFIAPGPLHFFLRLTCAPAELLRGFTRFLDFATYLLTIQGSIFLQSTPFLRSYYHSSTPCHRHVAARGARPPDLEIATSGMLIKEGRWSFCTPTFLVLVPSRYSIYAIPKQCLLARQSNVN